MLVLLFLFIWAVVYLAWVALQGFASSRASGPSPKGDLVREILTTGTIAVVMTLIVIGIGALFS